MGRDEIFAKPKSIIFASVVRLRRASYHVTRPSWLRIALVAFLLVLAGCDGLSIGNNPATVTATETVTDPVNTSTVTSAPTETSTPTATPTPPPQDWSQERKFTWFSEEYDRHASKEINTTNVSLVNETMQVTYEMRNPNNKSRVRYEQSVVLVVYSGLANSEFDGSDRVNKSWVPKRLEVTQVAPNGNLYSKYHTNYTNAMRFERGDWGYAKYYFAYLNTGEHGPAWETYNS